MRIPWMWRIAAHARHQRHQAEAEVQRSKRNLAESEHLSKPIARSNQRNHYSDLIRDALQIGYGPPTPVHGTRRPR